MWKAAAVMALFAASPAIGQGANCGPRDAVVERLGGGYGESVQSMGLGSSGTVFEFWANVETGTWTVVINYPDGQACIPASGQNFEHIKADIQPKGDKT